MRTYHEQGVNGRRQGLILLCHLVTLSPCLLVIFLFGLKLSNGPSPEELLQQGHRALARGDYERAAALFEQAEVHSTEPAEVAFYLAGAKFHLARKVEGISPELLEAEQLYRCCLDPSDPHRPRALCGLGNCLLHKAGSSDEGSLRSAIACYDLCLQCASDDKALASAARYNREKARLLLLQFLPPISDSASERPPIDDLHPRLPRPYDYRQAMPMPAGMDGADGNADPQSAPGDGKQDQNKDAAKNNEPPQPGKGNLPPVPDEVDVPPLSSQIAGEHLKLAAKKVLQERQIHHRRDEETSAKGVKDW
jgi:tetratricopeptide (TPR) repeat protein